MAKSGSGRRAFSRWMQHRTNARMIPKVRNGKGAFMGMDVLILKTVGRKSGQLRETPVARFGDGKDSWILVGSGGKANHRYLNLGGTPDRASVELPDRDAVPVTPHVLEGAERERLGSSSPPLSPASRSIRASPTGSTRWSDSPRGDRIRLRSRIARLSPQPAGVLLPHR
jgi:deazaflavin-dependent oxidoreductase (nitroreductase family)